MANAGIVLNYGNQLEITEKAYDKMFSLNTKSTFFLIKESYGLLKKGTDANVLAISTVAA